MQAELLRFLQHEATRSISSPFQDYPLNWSIELTGTHLCTKGETHYDSNLMSPDHMIRGPAR